MSDHKIVYLIIERGNDPEKPSIWRMAGNAYICRDGSLNVKLDVHPGLIFNIRDPKIQWRAGRRRNCSRNADKRQAEQRRHSVWNRRK